ncbi:MAG: glycosyltransferase [Desulfovibrionaceae bacterium]|nr:glycosyltransferase [Desulfovibrionaceae bacterium]
MLERIEHSGAMRFLLPGFSRRRAVAARLWQGLRESLSGFALARRHGLRPALRQMRWRRQAKHSGPAAAAYIPPLDLQPQLLAEAYPEGLPLISIVAPLSAELEKEPFSFFLKALFRQNYPGPVELVLVNYGSRLRAETAREDFYQLKKQFPSAAISLNLLHTRGDSGEGHARNMGFEAAAGDIVVITDSDCLMNAAFLSLHALYMAWGPYDALLGPVNEGQKQRDSLCPTGFVNCLTRNFSLRKSAAPRPLFEEAFSSGAAPDSGLGWAEVAMGRALYDAGLRLGYAEGTFSAPVSPGPDCPAQGQAWRSLSNFVKLLEKYPDMPEVAGRWVRDTYSAILNTDGQLPAPHTPLRRRAERLMSGSAATRIRPISPKRLRILSFHWHTAHQYELFKLPHDFFLVHGVGAPASQKWNIELRPAPDNIRFISHRGLDPRDYDLAIVPFDENVLAPQYCNGVLHPRWGELFLWFLHNVPLPKIGICHGTPLFYGQWDITYAKPDLMRVIEAERLRLVEAVKDFTVVCNSHQAEREWGFARSTVIWHGFDPMEFPPRDRESFGCLTLEQETMRAKPFYNGFFIHRETCVDLPEAHTPHHIKVPSPRNGDLKGNLYARAKFRNYVDELRKYAVYFNPTVRSCMPRTRGEAMLCGLVPVSLLNHDADMFIKNGVNGFIGSCPRELREHITFCLERPAAAWKIGLEARKSACALFSLDRYLAEWQTLLQAAI